MEIIDFLIVVLAFTSKRVLQCIISAIVFTRTTIKTIVLSIILKKTVHKRNAWLIPFVPFILLCLLFVSEVLGSLTYQEYHKLCHDPQILSSLKNDACTPEFVLAGKYYELPCPLQTFVGNGWTTIRSYTDGKYIDFDDVLILEGQYASFHIKTPYGCLDLVTECTEKGPTKLNQTTVIAAFYSSRSLVGTLQTSPNHNFFVTKSGLTETTEKDKAKELTSYADSDFFSVSYTWMSGISSDDYGNYYEIRTDRFSKELNPMSEHSYDRLNGAFFTGGCYDLNNDSYEIKRPLTLGNIHLIILLSWVLAVSMVALSVVFVLRKKRKRHL